MCVLLPLLRLFDAFVVFVSCFGLCVCFFVACLLFVYSCLCLLLLFVSVSFAGCCWFACGVLFGVVVVVLRMCCDICFFCYCCRGCFVVVVLCFVNCLCLCVCVSLLFGGVLGVCICLCVLCLMLV